MAGDISNTKYLTNVAELTVIANAIRAKGGTTTPLVYPNGFVTAINNIQAGSGGVDIKVDELTPDCYFCDKDDRTAYLDLSNVITGTCFSFCICTVGSVFDPNRQDDELDGSPCLICGIYTGDDSDTSPDSVNMKSISISDSISKSYIPIVYDPTIKRIDVSSFFKMAKGDAMPSVIDYIVNSYVINWN